MSVLRPSLAARVDLFATGPWQVVGLVAANHAWTRGLAGLAARSPLVDSTAAEISALSAGSTIGLALLEELVFRGALFGWLRGRFGGATAILGSAVLFATVHAPPVDALVAFLLGLQLGALRQALGLGVAIAAHVASNLAFLAIAASPNTEAVHHPAVFALAVGIGGSAIAALVQRMRKSTP